MKELSRGVVPKKPAPSIISDEIIALNVSVLGKEFQVSCPPDEQDDLVKAAIELDKMMRDIRDNGKVIGLERIAIMAALNITNEFLQAKDKIEGKETASMLRKLNRKLDNALQSAKQMEI